MRAWPSDNHDGWPQEIQGLTWMASKVLVACGADRELATSDVEDDD
jgi:hypothetical protein